MRTRRILSAIIAVIMVLALVPVAAFAQGIADIADEATAMRKLDTIWADLAEAEADAIASGATKIEVINTVYEVALNDALVDNDSFSDFTKDGFFFTVDGMYCAYNYRLRNELNKSVVNTGETVVLSSNGVEVELKDATSPNVLLVGPYYGGYDPSFTDQYRNEVASIAAATGGECTILEGHAATGPAIAAAFPDKGVVIYDSHGTQAGTSSYLCLTTNEGITQEDYNNGWAVRSGNEAFIDGRYIENHITAPLDNPIVWMAICEGMKRNGNGTTGAALLRAGCGIVYGYSQNVTFIGDYVYEATFWNVMKEGGSVDEAFQIMKDTHGVPDPYGDAYPIVMSPVDPFPENPDSEQQVFCDWTMFGSGDTIPLESFELSETELNLEYGHTATIEFSTVPVDANIFTLSWSTSDESVVRVSGNRRRANVTAVGGGEAVVTCTVMVGDEIFGTAETHVTVSINEELATALNTANGNLIFSTSAEYPFVSVEDAERIYAMSSNAGVPNSESSVTLTVDMEAGEELSFDYIISSQSFRDLFRFYVNSNLVITQYGTNTTDWRNYTYTANTAGTYVFEWSYAKDGTGNSGDDCLKLDNIAYSGEDTPPEIPHDGDVDGDGNTTISDALMIARHAMGLMNLNEEQLIHADVNESGNIEIADALIAARIAIGLA